MCCCRFDAIWSIHFLKNCLHFEFSPEGIISSFSQYERQYWLLSPFLLSFPPHQMNERKFKTRIKCGSFTSRNNPLTQALWVSRGFLVRFLTFNPAYPSFLKSDNPYAKNGCFSSDEPSTWCPISIPFSATIKQRGLIRYYL
jgi:hypothetical protein